MMTPGLVSSLPRWRKRKTFESTLLRFTYLVLFIISGTRGDETFNELPQSPSESPPPADAPFQQPPEPVYHTYPTPHPSPYPNWGENQPNFQNNGYQEPYPPRDIGYRNYRPPRFKNRPFYPEKYPGNGSDQYYQPRQPYQRRGRRPFNRYEDANFNANASNDGQQNDTHNVNVEGERKSRQQDHEREKKSKIGKVFRFVKNIFRSITGTKKKSADDDLKDGNERKIVNKNEKTKDDRENLSETDDTKRPWIRNDRKFSRPRHYQNRNFNNPNFKNYPNNPDEGYQPHYRNPYPESPDQNYRDPNVPNQQNRFNQPYNADNNQQRNGDFRNNKYETRRFNYKPFHNNYNHPDNPDNKPRYRQDDQQNNQEPIVTPGIENSNTRSMDSDTRSVNSNTRSPESDTGGAVEPQQS